MQFLPRWITNKYFLATCFFVVWLAFFDHNDMILSYKRKKELKELKDKKAYYQDRIQETRDELNAMRVNTASLEKVAREKYLMKKDNEDLYVIEEK
ncbi:MAG TPA: septum formation initiator family protein [Chitinophagaceae bacterium]|nr:septum formation initiator family protein [Chitinophagaceae bacterium]